MSQFQHQGTPSWVCGLGIHWIRAHGKLGFHGPYEDAITKRKRKLKTTRRSEEPKEVEAVCVGKSCEESKGFFAAGM